MNLTQLHSLQLDGYHGDFEVTVDFRNRPLLVFGRATSYEFDWDGVHEDIEIETEIELTDVCFADASTEEERELHPKVKTAVLFILNKKL